MHNYYIFIAGKNYNLQKKNEIMNLLNIKNIINKTKKTKSKFKYNSINNHIKGEKDEK